MEPALAGLRSEVRSAVRSGGDMPPGTGKLLVGWHIGIIRKMANWYQMER